MTNLEESGFSEHFLFNISNLKFFSYQRKCENRFGTKNALQASLPSGGFSRDACNRQGSLEIEIMARALLLDPYSSKSRPALRGVAGAVSAAHPLAVAAAQDVLGSGGNAVDAVIAAQAILCVVAPEACGLGGDGLALVRLPDRAVTAINGFGGAPQRLGEASIEGGNSITVPGVVHAWAEMSGQWGSLPFGRLLAPAIRIARQGFRVGAMLATTVDQQRARLVANGGGEWNLLSLRSGEAFAQPALADLLQAIGRDGAAAFYRGPMAEAIARAVARQGGAMSAADLAAYRTVAASPITTTWRGMRLSVQPPMSQGILLPMCLDNLERLGTLEGAHRDHAAIELTEASFAFRDRVGEGKALLDTIMSVDLARAGKRGGPRSYLHTAGAAVADASGLLVTSLVSVFDDFGSCVFVPEGGFTLNNRAASFTEAPNHAEPGKRPVHTLAPVIVEMEEGAIGLATPGADGQIQTLMQILASIFIEGIDLASAIDRPRWRSENGKVLIEETHANREALAAFGHELVPMPDGRTKFGAIVCAGHLAGGPICVSDWRRETWSGVT